MPRAAQQGKDEGSWYLNEYCHDNDDNAHADGDDADAADAEDVQHGRMKNPWNILINLVKFILEIKRVTNLGEYSNT